MIAMGKTLHIIFTFLIIAAPTWAQPAERKISKVQYVDMWKDVAIQHMNKYDIPASITLAQGILESANGNSALAKYANNHFGIKCHEWKGEGFYKDDDQENECFRRYFTAEESYEDHALFLKNRSRYSFLFDLKPTDYKGWAKGLKKAGYATNPKYPQLLIKIIEEQKLYEYDQLEFVPTVEKKPETTYSNSKSVLVPKNKHKVLEHKSDRKFIKVMPGDTYYKIAQEFNMGMWQLYKYNDFGKRDVLIPGEIIYLQPKRNKAPKSRPYLKASGESLRKISQQEGIKLKKLMKFNPGLTADQKLENIRVALR